MKTFFHANLRVRKWNSLWKKSLFFGFLFCKKNYIFFCVFCFCSKKNSSVVRISALRILFFWLRWGATRLLFFLISLLSVLAIAIFEIGRAAGAESCDWTPRINETILRCGAWPHEDDRALMGTNFFWKRLVETRRFFLLRITGI